MLKITRPGLIFNGFFSWGHSRRGIANERTNDYCSANEILIILNGLQQARDCLRLVYLHMNESIQMRAMTQQTDL